jgi:hypothetical protein
MKTQLLLKKILWRIFLYLPIFLLLLLIPAIYAYNFVCCGCEMFLFISPFYIIWEIIVVGVLIFWLENSRFFAKKNLKIEDSDKRQLLIFLITFAIFFISKSLLLRINFYLNFSRQDVTFFIERIKRLFRK